MCCSVVFGVTSRLLVINISSSSPAINAAAYYQRCVITCDTLAMFHRRPRLQHLPVTALTQAVKPDQNRDFCLPHLHSTPPLGGWFPSEYCYAVWHGKTRMAWLPDGGKILMIRLFSLTQLMNVTDRQTDTAWRHRPHLCIASCGKNGEHFKRRYRAEEYAISQLHRISHAEINKFLLAYVILLKHVYFRQYFACVCMSCAKKYLTAATYYCQVEVKVHCVYLRDYRSQ